MGFTVNLGGNNNEGTITRSTDDTGSDGISTTNTVGESSTVETVTDKVKEKAAEATEDTIETLLLKGSEIPDTAKAAGAFVYALVDGWTLGGLSGVASLTGLGNEVDEFQAKYPNLTTAGDVASYLSPAIAIKIWKGALSLGAKGVTKALGNQALKSNQKGGDKVVEAFGEYAKKNRGAVPIGTDFRDVMAKGLGVSKGKADELIARFNLNPKMWSSELMTIGYGGAKAYVKQGQTLASAAATLGKTSRKMSDALKYLRGKNIELIDIYQVAMAYKQGRDYFLGKGFSEEEANQGGRNAAFMLLLGKGVTTQGIDRIMGVFSKGVRKQGPIYTLLRPILEAGIGATVYHFGNIEDVAGNLIERGVDFVESAAAPKNRGGLVAMSEYARRSPTFYEKIMEDLYRRNPEAAREYRKKRPAPADTFNKGGLIAR